MANSAHFPIARRDAFLIPTGPDLSEDQFHFFVVLTDPAKHDSVLLVNATTLHPNVPYDPACILEVGDHAFIRRRSYILYSKARKISLQRLRQLIAAKTILYRPPPISPVVFERIAAGVSGGQMSPEYLDFYQLYK